MKPRVPGAFGSTTSKAASGRFRAWCSNLDHQLALLIVLFTLPLSLPALYGFFTFDDLMNLHYYVQRPWLSALSNLIVFTSLHRPLGALLYLPLYLTAGLVSWPYYLVGILVFSLNILLTFRIFLRLTGNRFVTVLATALFALHPMIHNVLYNFGAVYELTCLALVEASLLRFLRWWEQARDNSTPPSRPAGEHSRTVLTGSIPLGSFSRRDYILSFLFFLAALNAKETAVTLPGILFAYLWIYGPRTERVLARIQSCLKPVAPFLLVTIPYALAKAMGSEAYWRDNPLYAYHFDSSIFPRLARYLDLVSNDELSFSVSTALLAIGATLALGVWFKNRHVLFGLCWAGLFLLPVLPLPRVWELFLYLPLVGFTLATSALIFQVGRTMARFAIPARWYRIRFGHWTSLALTALCLFRLLGAMTPDVDRSRRTLYQERNPSWQPFAEQLHELFSTLPPDCTVAFVAPPFDPDSEERWCLNFLVWLSYGNTVRVLRLPQDQSRFDAAVQRGVRVRVLRWDGRRLRPIRPDQVP